MVGDKPWSGFNYYLGDYRSTVAVNADLRQQMANLPHADGARVLSRATTPSTAARRPAWWRAWSARADDLPGEHPAVPDGRGTGRPGAVRHDRARLGSVGARRSTPTWGCGSTANVPRRCRRRPPALADVRQDAALMLHDEHRDVDDVVGVPAALAAGRRRAGPADAAVSVLAAVARLHQHLRRGVPAAAGWLDGRPAGVSLTAAVRPAAGRAADPVDAAAPRLPRPAAVRTRTVGRLPLADA